MGTLVRVVRQGVLTPEQWEFWDVWMRAQRLLTHQVDRCLQREYGISKAEFSVLVTLRETPAVHMRVGDLAEAIDWDKGRVAHQLTRMENRGLVERSEGGAYGRRTGVGLTPEGRRVVEQAIEGHGANLRRLFFDTLTPEQAAAIRSWSEQTIEAAEPCDTTSTAETPTSDPAR